MRLVRFGLFVAAGLAITALVVGMTSGSTSGPLDLDGVHDRVYKDVDFEGRGSGLR